MKNNQVIEEFVRGGEKSVNSHTKNLRYTAYNRELINYNTVIARWYPTSKGWAIDVNTRKYSQTTSKIQNQLLNRLRKSNLAYTTHN